MKVCFYLILTIVIFSCQSKKDKVLSLEDVSKGSQKYSENNKEVIKVNDKKDVYSNLQEYSKKIIDTFLFLKENIVLLDSSQFTDRFGAKKAEKWYVINKKDSFTYNHWQFKDSNTCYSTFFNYLDCFGQNCKSYIVGHPKKFYKNRSVLMLIHQNNFWILESKLKIDKEKLLSLFSTHFQHEKWKFIVHQDIYSKSKWFQQNDKNTRIEIIN
ncbi:MAG: hypothetical protein HYU67_05160 [Flavobacteriia bacterium]|nr:hypothetical protein [Flavobacteriia bacterium]